MKLLRKIKNYNGKEFELYIDKTEDNMYYLCAIPEDFNENCNVVVESYNSGGKQKSNYEENILSALNDGNAIENTLMEAVEDAPIVLPITPDLIEAPDYQQLSIEAIKEGKIYSKFLRCIEDAKQKILELSGKKVSDKIFLNGYSASGVFAQRFALIHPEIVARCLIGGAAGTIPMPLDEIDYPIGIKNYEELFGRKFDIEIYKKIQFGYYVAENEEREPGRYDINGERIIDSSQIPAPMHDMSYRAITTPKEVGKKQRELFGETMNERYKNAIDYYKNLGIDISGIVLRGANHSDIFNSRTNRSADYLKQQIINFYINKEPLKYDLHNCVEGMDKTFQESRTKEHIK